MGLYGYFYGVYELILRGKQNDFWVKLGDIRGLWGDPWRIEEI